MSVGTTGKDVTQKEEHGATEKEGLWEDREGWRVLKRGNVERRRRRIISIEFKLKTCINITVFKFSL
jgi:hypothetical protein